MDKVWGTQKKEMKKESVTFVKLFISGLQPNFTPGTNKLTIKNLKSIIKSQIVPLLANKISSFAESK